MKPYYSHAGIEIYHGDCREVLPSLHQTPDALITDPQYGIGFAAQPTDYQRAKGKLPEHWDDAPFEHIDMIIRFGRVQAIWGGNYYALPPSRGWLCWYKPDAPPSMAHCELAWTNQDVNTRLIIHSIAATNGERVGHPTQKPEAVMRWTIQQIAPTCSLILDPFCGSGTTLVAAKHLGKSAIGIEINEAYCELGAKRLAQEVFSFEANAPAVNAEGG